MKHKPKVTVILLVMFLVTQLIGIYTITAYAPTNTITINQTTGEQTLNHTQPSLPFGLQYEETQNPTPNFLSIIFALIFAFVIFSILMKYQLKYIMKIWFATVILIAISLTLYPLLQNTSHPSLIALLIAVPLMFYKVIKPNIYVHNATELLIYPGIAIVIAQILYSPTNPTKAVAFMLGLLILISIYDAWAVWHSGIMQKMAKYQMEEVQVFGGFLIPTLTPKEKEKINALKNKYKGKEIPQSVKNKKIKINLAVLGGGDIIFPIITMAIVMWSFPNQILWGIPGLIPGLFVLAGALAGITYLLLSTQKDKAYPAMPYITTGILLSLGIWKLFW